MRIANFASARRFRWDYISHLGGDTSGFKEFLKEGVSAEYVKTIFPSLSFPAWTTISTGTLSTYRRLNTMIDTSIYS